jgi:hypothetical protein
VRRADKVAVRTRHASWHAPSEHDSWRAALSTRQRAQATRERRADDRPLRCAACNATGGEV